MTVFDLSNLHLIVDRPGATPAPLTAADCGLTNDPIAHILELRAALETAIDALTPAQRAELVQYGWPQAPGLKAVA